MQKKKYIKPSIEWIPLDSAISLQLESNPPMGPNEAAARPEFFNGDNAFKIDVCLT